MCSLDTFKIDLKGLPDETTVFRYSLDDDYFKAISAPDVQRGKLQVELKVRKADGFFELDFHTEGSVYVPCNLCLEDMEVAIDADNRLIAKFGDEYSDDDDLVTVDENEGMLDVSWFVYEFIELDFPIRHVHAPGKCNPAMMKLLQEHSAARSSEVEEEKTAIDPRWGELMKLKTKD